MGVFRIDGVEVPSPSEVTPSFYTVGRYWRNSITAGMNRHTIAMFRKSIWVYKALTNEEVNTLYNCVFGKMLHDKQESFNITTQSPGEGFVESLCYLGAEVKFSMVSCGGGGVNLWKTELHWIETDGRPIKSVPISKE